MVVGITGNTGSGKTEVATILSKKTGGFTINADKYGHALLENDPEIAENIFNAFGETVIDQGGGVIRKKLAEIVFKNGASLTKLNRIMHDKMTRGIYDQIINGNRIYNLIIVDCALIYEWNILSFFDKVITVTANPDVRLERLLTFRKMLEEDAVMQMSSQMDDAIKVDLADYVIVNESSLEELEKDVEKIMKKLKLS